MAELPELQVFRKNIEKKFAGKILLKIEVFKNEKVNAPESELKKKLVGIKLKSITREGKELFFNFENGQVLAFHLMLTGEFHFYHGSNLYKNKTIELLFENNDGLLLTDWKHNANVKFNPEISEVPDALSEGFSPAYLSAGLKKK